MCRVGGRQREPAKEVHDLWRGEIEASGIIRRPTTVQTKCGRPTVSQAGHSEPLKFDLTVEIVFGRVDVRVSHICGLW